MRNVPESCDFGRSCLSEAGRRIDSGAHCRATEREPVDTLQRIFDPLEIVREHALIARPFLSECEWRGVLHVCAADLDDVLPLLNLRSDCSVQRLDRRNKPLLYIDRRSNAHCGGKRVVRRLGHVDVIIGMNRGLAPERRARDLAATVGDHLIDVHVELRAAAGHPNVQREHVLMLAGENLVADLNDQLVALVVEPLAGMVGIGGGFLQGSVCGNHLPRD